MKTHRTLSITLLLATLLALLAACGGTTTSGTATTGTGGAAKPTVKVGSKDFTEQDIVGEMYALLLEDAGYTVERKLHLGGTPVAHAGLLSGEIDVYPEYTGTGLLNVLSLPVETNRQKVFQTVSDEYKKQFNLVWLEPAPMNNTQALAMTEARAAELGIGTISDMVAKADQLVLVGAPEFQEREDGIPGIKKVYGDFTLKEFVGVDAGLRYQTLTEGRADVTVAYGTDGEIAAFDLVVLQDDKGLFPPYQLAPVVRQQLLDASPEVRDVLNKLAPKLTDSTMQRLNNEVSTNKREPADVARDFLEQEGLIKATK